MTLRRALVLLPALLLAGCGGAAKKTGEPARAPSAPASPGPAAPAGGYAAPPPASLEHEAPDNTAPPSSSKDDRDIERAMPTLEDALSALKQASTRLSSSGNDCGTACKALGSMRRAADRICELEPDGPEDRCEHARQRVKDAEKRVHSGCGEC